MNSCAAGEVKKAITSSTKLVWLEVCGITSINNFAMIITIIFITSNLAGVH